MQPANARSARDKQQAVGRLVYILQRTVFNCADLSPAWYLQHPTGSGWCDKSDSMERFNVQGESKKHPRRFNY